MFKTLAKLLNISFLYLFQDKEASQYQFYLSAIYS